MQNMQVTLRQTLILSLTVVHVINLYCSVRKYTITM